MLAVIDYGMGNTGSIGHALARAHIPYLFTGNHAEIEAASHLLLCGVGAFDRGMQQLHERGLAPLLQRKVLEQHTPLLGICLGLQLLSRKSEEGTALGLGWLEADTVKFQHSNASLKIPHMGWNTVNITRPHPLMRSIPDKSEFYFMHSYHLQPDSSADTCAVTDYGISFPSIMVRNNIMGVQFHPEKSREQGVTLLQNFARLQA